MMHRLTTDYAKNSKIIVIGHLFVQVILENVVTCFFLGHNYIQYIHHQIACTGVVHSTTSHHELAPSVVHYKAQSLQDIMCIFKAKGQNIKLRPLFIPYLYGLTAR